MKNSHGQTAQYHCPNCGYTAEDAAIHGDHYLCERKTGHPDPRKAEKAEPQAPTIVQDYREYTAEEIRTADTIPNGRALDDAAWKIMGRERHLETAKRLVVAETRIEVLEARNERLEKLLAKAAESPSLHSWLRKLIEAVLAAPSGVKEKI